MDNFQTDPETAFRRESVLLVHWLSRASGHLQMLQTTAAIALLRTAVLPRVASMLCLRGQEDDRALADLCELNEIYEIYGQGGTGWEVQFEPLRAALRLAQGLSEQTLEAGCTTLKGVLGHLKDLLGEFVETSVPSTGGITVARPTARATVRFTSGRPGEA